MTRIAEADWHLAHDLHAHAPLDRAEVLDEIFEELQREQVVLIKIEAESLDSSSVKVHPDGAGASKKWT